jgi:epoxyqueuosine reductase
MNRNYQKELEQVLLTNKKENRCPTLLLHSCCAPCSSYVIEYLSNYFSITVFYYNPNIDPPQEFLHRMEEERLFIEKFPAKHPVSMIEAAYDPKEFYAAVKGLEHIPEGGKRCEACFRLRLEKTAYVAAKEHFDYFTTTLTISPLKNAALLNEIGEETGKQYHVSFLNSDFKKKNGYKRSVELSAQYGLYRQDYCGCVFSKKERELQKAQKGQN